MKKEILVIGIIFLFVGIAVAPSVTSIDISKNKTSNSNDLVEITLQLCKTSGVEDHTLFITKAQDEQLDRLIESFKAKLDRAETREETIEIYKDMVVSLDKLGFLPESTNCKEIQKLVTGGNIIGNPEMKSIKHFELANKKFKNRNLGLDENENMFCLISGETTTTVNVGIGAYLSGILAKRILEGNDIIDTLERYNLSVLRLLIGWLFGLTFIFLLFTTYFLYLSPLNLGGFMTFGKIYYPYWDGFPAKGWVSTIGLNGKKTWTSPIYGNILELWGNFGYYVWLLGAIGFTGIKFGSPRFEAGFKSFYLGSALMVKLTNDKPPE